jgi:hypothetical protein
VNIQANAAALRQRNAGIHKERNKKGALASAAATLRNEKISLQFSLLAGNLRRITKKPGTRSGRSLICDEINKGMVGATGIEPVTPTMSR